MALVSCFCIMPAVLAQTQCPSTCSCLLPSDAKKMGYTLCGGKQVICGYDKAQNPLYCYQKPVTTTTTKPTTTQTAVVTAAPAVCPSECSCMALETAKQYSYLLCGGKQILCGYDKAQNPLYCYQKPVTASPTTIPTTFVTQAIQTLEGVSRATIVPPTTEATLPVYSIERTRMVTVASPTPTLPMAVATTRWCTISGNVYGFYHRPESLKIQLTNLDTGGITLTSVTPVYSGDLVSHYSYSAMANCDGNYQIDPIYQPYSGICAWTGSFSGENVVHMTGASESGRDFTYLPADSNIPEVSINPSPASPGINGDVRVNVDARDDDSIVYMAVRYDLVYADGTRRSVDWTELTPMPGIAYHVGDLPLWTGHFDITDDNLVRAEISARVCDRGGNERSGFGTVVWTTCDWCGDHVIPLQINGNPDQKIDVIFVPDTSYGGDMDAFVEDIWDVIENGYYQNDAFSDNRGKFNFYYLDDEADVTAYPACGFTPPLGSCENFQDATTFADSMAVLHTDDFRDWSGSKCGRSLFCSEPTSYRTFVHESGHALFGLKDEYCCDSRYSQNDPNPNIWESRTACRDDATAEGWDPEQCREFCTAGSGNCGSGFWKNDPDRCVMRCSQACGDSCCLACGGAGAMCQYEPACSRRVNAVLSLFS